MVDIPALSLIKDKRSQIPTIHVEQDLKLTDIKAYNRRAASFVDDSYCTLENIAEYIQEIQCQLGIFQRELKNQMLKQTDIMKILLQRISQEDVSGFKSHYSETVTGFKSHYSETVTEYVNEIKTTIELNEKQEALLALKEKCCQLADACRKNFDLMKKDLQYLRKDIEAYAGMIETAEEKKVRKEAEKIQNQREEKEKKEKEERQKREEKEREKKEKNRRNPENWKPFIYHTKKQQLDPNVGDETVCCVVYAMPESVSKHEIKCSVLECQTEVQKWLDRPREQQMSLPILVIYEGSGPISFEVPMRLYIPYSAIGITHSPKLKLSIDDGTWIYPEPLPRRKIKETPGVDLYIGSEVTSFRSLKAIVVGVPKHDTMNVPRKGCTIRRPPYEIKIPSQTFESDTANVCVEEIKDSKRIISTAKKTDKDLTCLRNAQVVKLTCSNAPKKDIQVEYSEKEYVKHANFMSASTEAIQCLKESKKIKREPFMEKLLDAELITKTQRNELQKIRMLDPWLKSLLNILKDKPSQIETVIQCLKDSGNGEIATKIQSKVKEMTSKTSMQAHSKAIFCCQTDDVPKVVGNKIQVKHSSCNLMAVSTEEHADQDTIEHAVKNLNHYLQGVSATFLCRQKSECPIQCFLQIVASDNVALQIQRLNDLGFKSGPMETAEFCIFDNEIVTLHFKGNIGLEYKGKRFFGEETFEIPFKVHRDAVKVNGELYVVDELVEGETYRGNLTYTIEAFGQTPKRQDTVQLLLPKKEDHFKYICPYPRVKALTRFIAHHMVPSNHSGTEWLKKMMGLDEPSVIKKIHTRVLKQEKNSTEQMLCESFMAIWANEDPDDENRLEDLVLVLKDTELQKEAKAYVDICTYKGLFSNMSIKQMATMMGPEWKSLAYDHLGMTTDDVSFIKHFTVEDDANHRAMLLDRFRFSDIAVELGAKLPEHFLDVIEKNRCSKELIGYCKSKIGHT